MLIHAIEQDLNTSPAGRGGEVHYTPGAPGHGGMGHNGDYLLTEWREAFADRSGAIREAFETAMLTAPNQEAFDHLQACADQVVGANA